MLWSSEELARLQAYGRALAPGIPEGPKLTQIIRVAALAEVSRWEATQKKAKRA